MAAVSFALDCKGDPDLLETLYDCMLPWGDDAEDFTCNTISKHAIVYSCGAIGLRGVPLRHCHDRGEIALARELSGEIATKLRGRDLGMPAAATADFKPFFVAANTDDDSPLEITDTLIRRRFGGTIYPPAPILIEPLVENGVWWSKVLQGVAGDHTLKELYLKQWRATIDWFCKKPELHAPAFVSIGERPLDRERRNLGCVFPRLVLALTNTGSLVGLFSYVVHSR